MFDDQRPIFHQIADQVCDDIVSGSLAEDDQVMSTNDYAAFYRINPATAAKAFRGLVDDGVLYKRRGVGMFVAPGAKDRLVAQRRRAFFAERLDAVVAEADLLDIPLDDVIRHLRERTTP